MRSLLAGLIVAAFMVLLPPPAIACDCIRMVPGPTPSKDRIVAVGTVQAIRLVDGSRIAAVEFLVSEAFQNTKLGARVTAYTDIGVGFACEAADVRVGRAYLFHTRPVRDDVPPEWDEAGRRLSRSGHIVGMCAYGGAMPAEDAEPSLRELRKETQRKE